MVGVNAEEVLDRLSGHSAALIAELLKKIAIQDVRLEYLDNQLRAARASGLAADRDQQGAP